MCRALRNILSALALDAMQPTLLTGCAGAAVDASARSGSNRPVTRALYSIMVAVITLIAVPVSQLRTVSVRIECCCPDPTHCHCGDHDRAPADQAAIKACHKSSETILSPSAPAFAAPVALSIEPSREQITTLQFPLRSPHESPSPARPPGPS
jgi:hypothetical protein